MTLTFTLRRANQAGFEEYLSGVQDRSSPFYRHFLTQHDLTEEFGPSQSSYDSVSSWLRSQGFTLVQGSTNRLTLTVKGSRELADRVFDVTTNDYRLHGRIVYANINAPALPPDIASEVQSIAGLSDVAQPTAHVNTVSNLPASLEGGHAVAPGYDTSEDEVANDCFGSLVPTPSLGGALTEAEFTFVRALAVLSGEFGVAGSLYAGVLAGAVLSAYCLGLAIGYSATHSDPPVAEKIGLLEFDTYHQSDVTNWLQLVGENPSVINQLSEVAVNGGVSTPGAGESEVLLDIDTLLGLVGGHEDNNVVVYDGSPSTGFASMFNAMINDGDTIISNSWMQCEDETSLANAQAIDSVLQQAEASGITVLNASGDTGSTCFDGSDSVAVPADSPNATSVGGATPVLGPGLTDNGDTWWNDAAADPPGGQGGFGVSQYFPRPAYQSGLTTATGRSVPDIAVDAEPYAGVQICQADAGGCPFGSNFGGTSMATPAAAGEVALLDQLLGSNVGSLNAALYPQANSSGFVTSAQMGSDFSHVGLGDPNWPQLVLALEHSSAGAVDPTTSIVAAIGGEPADGKTQTIVRVEVLDSNDFPVSGQDVTLAPSTGCSAGVSAASGPSDDVNGSVTFTVTDTVAETCTFTATDTTDGIVLSTQPTVTFVAPTATGAEIYGGPAQVNNDGTSQATITVYLENALDQPASGKTVTLSEGAGGAVITPAASTTPGTTTTTNSAGNAVFTATDTNAEAVNFTATDTTDGNLPVPGSVSVSFAPLTATCPTTLPTPASGTSVSAFATGISYNTEGGVFPGNVTENACITGSAPAFDSSGNAYIADTNDGTIHVLPPSGGALTAANQLPDASFPPDSIGQLVFGPDGSLYAGLINLTTDITGPEIVQLDPTTGATLRVVADSATGLPDCPYIMAVDPLSGDLFTDDECSGYAASNQISRISDPSGASPTVSDYYTTGGCNLGLTFAPDGTLYLANCNGEVDSITGTNTATPTESTVAAVSGTPFSVAVTGTNSAGHATSLDVFTYGGDVYSVDLTQSPPVVSTIATGTTFFYITATSANGCAYGSIPGSIVEVGPPSCASSHSPTTGPELSLSGPGVTSPPAGSSVTLTAQLGNVASPAGTPIIFAVSGANPQVKLVDANGSGAATFTYSALHPGTDTVTAYATPGTSSLSSNPSSFTWVAGTDTSFLTLNGSQEIGPVGSLATIDANLSDVSQSPATPVSGATVDVTVGSQTCIITTNSAGSGSCQVTPSTAGLLPVGATYSGSSTLTASTASDSFFAGGPSTTAPTPTLTSIAVTPANPSITKGATEQFTATGTYSDSSTANITSQVTWASGTTADATITSGGLATGVAVGSSTITATLGSVSGNTKLTVTAPTLTSIAVTPANPSITKGATEQFTATGTYSDSSTANITSQVTWASGTTADATITSGGLATGVAAGSSTITATLGSVSGNTKLTVTAPTLTSIAVTPANPSITKGATEQFTATGTYSDSSTANITSQVTWASGTTADATITSGGLATGVAVGTRRSRPPWARSAGTPSSR